MTDAAEQFEALKRGTVEVLLEQDLKKKLATGRPLRVKAGCDPAASDLHLGRTGLRDKLRQCQEF